MSFETLFPLARSRGAFSITTEGGKMTYIEILFVLTPKTISKRNVKGSVYVTNVILDGACI